jgi:hypothetical protein
VPLAGTLVYTISIDNAAGNNFTVSNNHIGGKAALNAGVHGQLMRILIIVLKLFI